MPDKPDCPHCGSDRAVFPEYEHWHCTNCQASFDDNPDEGGSYSNDPVRSAIHNEERRRNRRNEQGGRR